MRVFYGGGGEMLFFFRPIIDSEKSAYRLRARLMRRMRREGKIGCAGPVARNGNAYDDGLDAARFPKLAAGMEKAGFAVSERRIRYRVPPERLDALKAVSEWARERFSVAVRPFEPYRRRADAEKYVEIAQTVAPVGRQAVYRMLSANARRFRSGFCLLAERNGEAAGAILVGREGSEAVVYTLVTAPGSRRCGVTACLLYQAGVCGRRAGITGIRTGTVSEGNEDSRALIENLGAVPDGDVLIYKLINN